MEVEIEAEAEVEMGTGIGIGMDIGAEEWVGGGWMYDEVDSAGGSDEWSVGNGYEGAPGVAGGWVGGRLEEEEEEEVWGWGGG